jgi:O-antigen/teichoic acid export membrane protein
MFALLRQAVRAIIMLVLPVSLLLGIGADVWVRCLFSHAFEPSATSLRILAPMFLSTYLAMLAGTCLVLLQREWTCTVVAILGLAANAILGAVLIPRAARWLGPGGASAGAAMAVVLSEVGVTAAFLAPIGARVFDRATMVSAGKAALCALLVIGAHATLRPLGVARLGIDVVLYFALLFALGGLRVEDAKQVIQLFHQGHGRHAVS